MAEIDSPQPVVLSARFADFDQLAEAVEGWDLRFRQLDAGVSPCELDQVTTPNLNVMRVRMTRRYFQAGAAPRGARTIALVEEHASETEWCGHRVLASTLQTFRSDGDFEAVSDPGFEAYTITARPERLATIATALGLPDPEDCVGGRESQLVDASASMGLRVRLRSLFRDLADSGGDPSALRGHLAELPEELVRAYATAAPVGRPPSASTRARARRRAIDWIEERLREAPSVSQLSRELGVSRRTLEYAFREQLGVSPKRYLTARRLTAVRADLRRAAAGESVADVANRYGFWHMGDFARTYRSHFGELPSRTLRGRRSG